MIHTFIQKQHSKRPFVCTHYIFSLQQIKMRAQFSYELLKLESDAASNMIYVNGRLLHRTREEIGETASSVSIV